MNLQGHLKKIMKIRGRIHIIHLKVYVVITVPGDGIAAGSDRIVNLFIKTKCVKKCFHIFYLEKIVYFLE